MPNQNLQKDVRTAMNKLLGIEHDKDALRILPPPPDDLDWYEDDRGGPGPSICPMTPDWGNLRGEWNYRLYELFIGYVEAPPPDGCGYALDEESCVEIHEMFFGRLYRLKREIQAASPKSGEREHQTRERLAQAKKSALTRQRPNTRRKQVSKSSHMA